jgi:hypothetical protein
LLKERLKRIFLGGPAAPEQPAASPRGPGLSSPSARESDATYSRHSHGLEQFFSQIQSEQNLWILDLAGASQANVSFITSLGHRLYSVDFLRTLDTAFEAAGDDPFAAQFDTRRIDRFLDENLDFEERFFDGVMVWDSLEFLAPPLLKDTVERLYRITKPGSYLLAFFHAEEKAVSIPAYTYRIGDAGTLLLTPRGPRRAAQHFNNRAIEKLFQQFRSVKFFLARDHLREVIITR